MIRFSEFQKQFFNHLDYHQVNHSFGTSFMNPNSPKSGSIHYCGKESSYLIVLADYTIPHDFELHFNTDSPQLRLGLVYDGISHYRVKNNTDFKFYPAPFIAIEENISGHQNWIKGSHHHSIEIFISFEYINNRLLPEFSAISNLNKLGKNSSILYLPYNVVDILRYLEQLMVKERLTPLLLESKILECLAFICDDLASKNANILYDIKSLNTSNKLKSGYGGIAMSDIQAIRKARDILIENISNPPTVSALSNELYISEKKLTDGFKTLYHMTIGEYTKDLKVTTAASLLSLTELSVEEISQRVGYGHPSNLGRAFKAKYHQTPLQFRRLSQQ